MLKLKIFLKNIIIYKNKNFLLYYSYYYIYLINVPLDAPPPDATLPDEPADFEPAPFPLDGAGAVFEEGQFAGLVQGVERLSI